jgi:alanine racemase
MRYSRRQFLLVSSLGIPASFTKGASTGSFSQGQKNLMRIPTQDAWIELDLPAMAWNLAKIKEHVRVPVMAVIKANAYGHGLVQVGRFLDQSGIDALMVCRLAEAIQLRESGVRCPSLNFGPLFPGDADLLAEFQISQSTFTEDVTHLSRNAQKLGKEIKVHIHIDTGMGRMGIPHNEAAYYIESVAALEAIRIEGISTTLTEDQEFDRVQMERFLSLCRISENKGIQLGMKHAFSSAGVFTAEESSYLDMVRPGILLYGYYPNRKTQEEDRFSLRHVLLLKSRVAAVKNLRPGDSVSYHRAYTAEKKEKIAVIPVGYSDGYPFQAVGKGWVLIRGKKFPVIGDVTANHLEVRLDLDSPVSIGDEVVLLGSQGREEITADHLAGWAGVSTYKILLRLNPLLPRKIRESNPRS